MQCRKYFETLHEINLRKKEGYSFFFMEIFFLCMLLFLMKNLHTLSALYLKWREGLSLVVTDVKTHAFLTLGKTKPTN